MLPIHASHSIPNPFYSMSPAPSGITGDRVTELFHKATPTPSLPPSLIEGEVISLTNFWKGPVEIVMIGVWGLLWALSLDQIIDIGKEVVELFDTAHEDRWNAVKQLCLQGVSFGGLNAYIATWAHDIKAVSLGAAANAVRMVGFGATCITSSVQIYRILQEILTQAEQMQHARNDTERTFLEHKQLLSGLELTASGAGAVWSFLGLGSLALGVALPGALMTALLGVWCITAITAIFYRIHLSKIYPAPAPINVATGMA